MYANWCNFSNFQLFQIESKKTIMQKINGMMNGWTAKGINKFQKTLFPIIFLVFTIFYGLAAYFKWGDIKPMAVE